MSYQSCPSCPYGVWLKDGTVTIVPHDMDCPVLAEFVATEASGICARCGSKKRTKRGRDNVGNWTKTWCPNGHSNDIRWDADS